MDNTAESTLKFCTIHHLELSKSGSKISKRRIFYGSTLVVPAMCNVVTHVVKPLWYSQQPFFTQLERKSIDKIHRINTIQCKQTSIEPAKESNTFIFGLHYHWCELQAVWSLLFSKLINPFHKNGYKLGTFPSGFPGGCRQKRSRKFSIRPTSLSLKTVSA